MKFREGDAAVVALSSRGSGSDNGVGWRGHLVTWQQVRPETIVVEEVIKFRGALSGAGVDGLRFSHFHLEHSLFIINQSTNHHRWPGGVRALHRRLLEKEHHGKTPTHVRPNAGS